MPLKSDYNEFKSIINERHIQYLVHFTRFESVTAIVGERKIIPRDKLHNISFDWQELVSPNTETRRDDPGFLNTSIMHPNIYLLQIFRDKWHLGSRFCILGIKTKYIYEKNTKFSITNATYSPAKKFGINGSLKTFNGMFGKEVSGKPIAKGEWKVMVRKPTLPNCYTTDSEAEVLIKSEIPYEDIIFIACRNKFEHDILASAFDVLELPTEKFCVQPTLFKDRI